jgi:hypothetical protein
VAVTNATTIFSVLFFSLLNILLMVSLDFSSESHNNNSIGMRNRTSVCPRPAKLKRRQRRDSYGDIGAQMACAGTGPRSELNNRLCSMSNWTSGALVAKSDGAAFMLRNHPSPHLHLQAEFLPSLLPPKGAPIPDKFRLLQIF